jgi:hypothetical protein
MGLTSIMAAMALALRILQEAPMLIQSVEAFWGSVTSHTAAPPHVEAAVQAAFADVRAGTKPAEG